MKRRTTRPLSILLALCMVLMLLPGTAWAEDTEMTCGENLTWSYNNGTLTIQGTGRMTDYFDYGTSSMMPPWRNLRDEIHTINIGANVTSIGNYAFWGCSSITSMSIPNSVTSIGNYAFWGCSSLTNITIPSSVTSIGNNAFCECSSLVSVAIPNTVTSLLSRQ